MVASSWERLKAAPSAGNTQNWHVEEPRIKEGNGSSDWGLSRGDSANKMNKDDWIQMCEQMQIKTHISSSLAQADRLAWSPISPSLSTKKEGNEQQSQLAKQTQHVFSYMINKGHRRKDAAQPYPHIIIIAITISTTPPPNTTTMQL